MSLAAAYSGLDIEYIDGVTTVSDKALPPEEAPRLEKGLNNGTIYAWRAHMNALRRQIFSIHTDVGYYMSSAVGLRSGDKYADRLQDRRRQRHLRPHHRG